MITIDTALYMLLGSVVLSMGLGFWFGYERGLEGQVKIGGTGNVQSKKSSGSQISQVQVGGRGNTQVIYNRDTE